MEHQPPRQRHDRHDEVHRPGLAEEGVADEGDVAEQWHPGWFGHTRDGLPPAVEEQRQAEHEQVQREPHHELVDRQSVAEVGLHQRHHESRRGGGDEATAIAIDGLVDGEFDVIWAYVTPAV